MDNSSSFYIGLCILSFGKFNDIFDYERKKTHLNEISGIADAIAAGDEGSTLLLSRLDQTHDFVEHVLIDLRPLVGFRVEGIADFSGGRQLLGLLHEFVVDLGVDEGARAGATALAVIVEKGVVSDVGCFFDCLINVSLLVFLVDKCNYQDCMGYVISLQLLTRNSIIPGYHWVSG